VGVQVKRNVKSLENTCHTWALLQWCFTTKRRYIKCMYLYLMYLYPTEGVKVPKGFSLELGNGAWATKN